MKFTNTSKLIIIFVLLTFFLIDQFLNGSSLTFLNSEFAFSEISSSSTPKYNTDTSSSIELQRPAIAYANSLILVPPDGQAITATPYFDYFDNEQKFKKYDKFDELNFTVTTSATSISDNFHKSQDYTLISASDTSTTSTLSSPSSTAFSVVLSERDEVYDDMISPSELSLPTVSIFSSRSEQDSASLTSSRKSETLQQSSHEINPVDNPAFFIGNIRNLPVHSANFPKDHRRDDDVDLNKLLKAIPEEIRRSPIKLSPTSAEKLNKIKVDEIFSYHH